MIFPRYHPDPFDEVYPEQARRPSPTPRIETLRPFRHSRHVQSGIHLHISVLPDSRQRGSILTTARWEERLQAAEQMKTIPSTHHLQVSQTGWRSIYGGPCLSPASWSTPPSLHPSSAHPSCIKVLQPFFTYAPTPAGWLQGGTLLAFSGPCLSRASWSALQKVGVPSLQ